MQLQPVRAAVRLPPTLTIRDIIRLYKLRAQRQLSQNFLLDEKLVNRIVSSAGKIRDSYVVEVGPGPGSITRAILQKSPKMLTVVEKDVRFVPVLEHLKDAVSKQIPMRIVNDDIFKFRLQESFVAPDSTVAPVFRWDDICPPIHIIGNLPFNVATHLIIRWIESISQRDSIWAHGRVKLTLTFQKEVAQRIAAPVLSDERCRLSVISQLWCHTKHHFDIPGKAFLPKPDVDVGVVTLTPLKEPLTTLPFKFIERVVRQVFNMRQKFSIRGAQTLMPETLRLKISRDLFELAEINPKIKPVEISNEDFVRLATAYKVLCKEYPELEKYDLRSKKII